MKPTIEPEKVWQIVGGKMVNSETKTALELGDKVAVKAIIHKCVAVFDSEQERIAGPVRNVDEGMIIHELKRCPLACVLNGVIVGVRFLSDNRRIYFCNEGYDKGTREEYSSRRPYLLVSFWPTHKPMLVDPADVDVISDQGLCFNWRKLIPRHPDADFRQECARKDMERLMKELEHERSY